MIWFDLIWFELNWIELNWIELNWFDLIWFDLIWFELIYIQKYSKSAILWNTSPLFFFFFSTRHFLSFFLSLFLSLSPFFPSLQSFSPSFFHSFLPSFYLSFSLLLSISLPSFFRSFFSFFLSLNRPCRITVAYFLLFTLFYFLFFILLTFSPPLFCVLSCQSHTGNSHLQNASVEISLLLHRTAVSAQQLANVRKIRTCIINRFNFLAEW